MRVACLQLSSVREIERNLAAVRRLVAAAVADDAELVLLPETFACMGGDEAEKRAVAESEDDSSILRFLSALAAQHSIAIIGGSLLLKGVRGGLRNTCPVFDSQGRLLALYDKIHLFDMEYQGEAYHESALMEAGDKPVIVTVDDFKIGLSICYDLRFPELYRFYVEQGCQLLCNVAAFTAITGRAHWQTLLRARAIENQCYLLASAQTGMHPDGRETWGHSMIINPWGEVVSELASGEGFVVADLSLNMLNQVRGSMPVLQHKKL